MTCRKGLFLFLLVALVGVPSARAQHEFEVTPLGGFKFGGNIQLPPGTSSNSDYLPIKNSADYGAAFDYSIWPNFQAEFMFLHQPTDIDEHFITGGQSFLTSADLNSYAFNFAYNLKPSEAKLKPFISAGLGFTNWRPTSVLPVSSNTFSYNIGGGVKYFFTDHVGLRAEVRWIPSRTTTQPEQYCDPFYGFCSTVPVSSHAQQGAVNGGIIFRFR
jgi:opacity protein-like surface antigen